MQLSEIFTTITKYHNGTKSEESKGHPTQRPISSLHPEIHSEEISGWAYEVGLTSSALLISPITEMLRF